MKAILNWFDNNAANQRPETQSQRVDWQRIIPFILLHVGCLAVLVVGVSWIAVLVAIAMYLIRMFAITAFYHRYFAHKAFKTSRAVQFVFALIGASATQRGPLWWAAHHRYHHRHADTDKDPHSPRRGFVWSHMGWFLTHSGFRTDYSLVPELCRFPELRWLDRFDITIPIILAMTMYALGSVLQHTLPELNTSGWQMLVWGYLVSTVILLHATLSINSLAHRIGKQRYQTGDDSRNSFWLALITLGEGWHNNHHHYPVSARQGFYWWEIDISFYLLKIMAATGLIWDLKTITPQRKNAAKLEQRNVS